MKQTSWVAFSIDRQSLTPVFEQICRALRGQVVAGEIEAGAKVLPTRVLATELGVSRASVVTAYEQLMAEGYLESHPGSGYTVCAMGAVELPDAPKPNVAVQEEAPQNLARAFEAGRPDMRLFPYAQWGRTLARICRENPQSLLAGGGVLGNFELRKAIADHVAEWRGIDASPQQIIITSGTTNALEMCLRTLTQAGDCVAIEDPGYMPLRHFVERAALSTCYLPIDAQGATLPEASANARLAVLTPSHQFPLGGAMSPGRRMAFIQWAKQHNAWIVEDDYDSEFRYAGRPIPALAGFDQLDRTLYAGSFSKIFSSSLRLGYLIVPECLLAAFRSTLLNYGVTASYLPQQALAAFIQNGEFYRHLRRMRRIYGERRKHLVARLAADFSDYGHYEDHQAGMLGVFHLNQPWVDAEIAAAVAEKGVTTAPLSEFCQQAKGHNGLLLGFGAFTEGEMEEALVALLQALRRT